MDGIGECRLIVLRPEPKAGQNQKRSNGKQLRVCIDDR